MDWQRLWPRYWFQNYPTNYQWDKFINDALDRGDVRVGNSCYVVLVGGVRVWASSYPFAYGSAYEVPGFSDVMPKVATRKRLRDALISAVIEDARKEQG